MSDKEQGVKDKAIRYKNTKDAGVGRFLLYGLENMNRIFSRSYSSCPDIFGCSIICRSKHVGGAARSRTSKVCSIGHCFKEVFGPLSQAHDDRRVEKIADSRAMMGAFKRRQHDNDFIS